MLFSLKSNQRQERRLIIGVDGTGTASITRGSGLAALTDTGTGDYLLTFARPFTRVPELLLTSKTGTVVFVPGTVSITSAQILGFAITDGTTATDGDFTVEIVGWDVADEYSENL